MVRQSGFCATRTAGCRCGSCPTRPCSPEAGGTPQPPTEELLIKYDIIYIRADPAERLILDPTLRLRPVGA